jgi:O-antigen/teichoic acid export membrane protein
MDKGRKQVIVLYVATFLGAILNFVASKVNTDYLSPSDYGDVKYVLNAIQLISWVVLFGWFLSGSRILALSDDREQSARIRGALIVFLAFAVSMLIIATLIMGLSYINRPEIRALFFFSLPVCSYPLLTNYMNTTAQGDNHIGRLALARVLPVLCYIPVAFYIYNRFGADSRTVLLLHWGVCSLVLVIIIFSTRPSFKNLKPVFDSIRKENHEYGIHLYWGSLAMVATNYLAGVTLGLFNKENTDVGFYTLALSFAQPLSYLPGIVGTTYFKRFVHEKRIPGKVFAMTIILTIVSCVGFMILVHPVMKLYNESYGVVAKYASWLAVGFSIHGVGDMINRYLGSHGQGLSIRNSSFACGAVKIVGSLLLVWLWNINGAIITLIFSSVVYTLSLFWAYYSFINKK